MEDISKMKCRKVIGKELYAILPADGRVFVYLVLMFIKLIFRTSSIN